VSSPDLASLPPPPPPFFKRRIVTPIVNQLTQGLTPHKIALTIAVGSGIALFPILGTTTVLCLMLGVFLKLNQPIVQAVNLVCAPLHLPVIYYSFKFGDRWLGATGASASFELRPMMELLRDHPLQFFQTYEHTALHAIIVWSVVVPFWAVVVYAVMLPIMKGIDKVRLENAATASASAAEKAGGQPVP
jgi:uncharacterized protein (DUF2062 family)